MVVFLGQCRGRSLCLVVLQKLYYSVDDKHTMLLWFDPELFFL